MNFKKIIIKYRWEILIGIGALLTLISVYSFFSEELSILDSIKKGTVLTSISATIIWFFLTVCKSKKNLKLRYFIPLLFISSIVLWLSIAQYRLNNTPNTNKTQNDTTVSTPQQQLIGINIPHTTVNQPDANGQPHYDEFIYYLLTGFGVIVTFIAFLIQYLANKQQAAKLEETQDINERSAFEGRYFNAISTFRDYVKSQKMRGIGEGQDVFRYMYWEYMALSYLLKDELKVTDDQIKQQIVFTIFLLGVTLDGENKTIRNYIQSMGLSSLTIEDIFKTIYEIQKSNDNGNKYLEEKIKENKFNYIRDYAKSSIWYNEKVMWYDGHKHRLLQFLKLRKYILELLENDKYISKHDKDENLVENSKKEIQKKYRDYFESLLSEYEKKLILAFDEWLNSISPNMESTFDITKTDYEIPSPKSK